MSSQNYLSFIGSSKSISSALNAIQYQPAPYWNGHVTFVFRLSAISQFPEKFDTTSTVIKVSLDVLPVNNPPVILWRGRPFHANEIDSINIREDSHVLIGGENLYYEDDDSFNFPHFNNFFSQAPHPNPYLGTAGLSESRRVVTRYGLQIADFDIGAGVVNVQVAVDRGSLAIDRSALNIGRSVSITMQRAIQQAAVPVNTILSNTTASTANPANGDEFGASILLSGDIFAVNMILGTLSYQSPVNANGRDYIKITVWDNGNTGDVFMNQSDTQTLVINLLPFNDAPVITLVNTTLGSLYVNETSWEVGLVYSEEDKLIPVGSYFDIFDPDFNFTNIDEDTDTDMPFSHSMASSIVYVSMYVEFGTLDIPVGGSLIAMVSDIVVSDDISMAFPTVNEELLSQDSINTLLLQNNINRNAHITGRTIVLFGQFAEMKTALKATTYTPNADWFGVDTFTVFINDLGNYGVGFRSFYVESYYLMLVLSLMHLHLLRLWKTYFSLKKIQWA